MTQTRMGAQAPTRPFLDEPTLVARAQDGDLDAFEQLVDTYAGRLFRLALRIVADRRDAEDVVQDSLVSVWRRLPQLTDTVAFSRWIHQVTTRTALNVLRTRQRRPSVPADPQTGVWGADARPGPADLTEERAVVLALEREVAALPDDLRVCWVLSAYDERGYAEIGDLLGVPVATVRGRIARARRRLAERMDPWR